MYVRYFSRAWVTGVLLVVWSSGLFGMAGIAAQEPPSEIIKEVHIFGPAPQMQIDATMSIEEGSSRSERRLNGWYLKENNALSLFVQIVEPPFLREMKLLLLRRGTREDNWMKTSRGVRRLGASDGRERVFGSHFTVADMTAIDPDIHTVRQVEAETDARPEEIVIDVLSEEEGSYRRFFIQESSRIIRGIQYYDSSGNVDKEYELITLGTVEGQPVPLEGRMRMANGDQTIITVNEIRFPDTIPSRYFNRGNL